MNRSHFRKNSKCKFISRIKRKRHHISFIVKIALHPKFRLLRLGLDHNQDIKEHSYQSLKDSPYKIWYANALEPLTASTLSHSHLLKFDVKQTGHCNIGRSTVIGSLQYRGTEMCADRISDISAARFNFYENYIC